MSYNGWTNYETWLTSLYFIQDDQFDDYLPEYANDVYGLSQVIESEVREYIDNEYTGDGYLSDMLGASLSEVNWREIAETLLDNYEPEEEG